MVENVFIRAVVVDGSSSVAELEGINDCVSITVNDGRVCIVVKSSNIIVDDVGIISDDRWLVVSVDIGETSGSIVDETNSVGIYSIDSVSVGSTSDTSVAVNKEKLLVSSIMVVSDALMTSVVICRDGLIEESDTLPAIDETCVDSACISVVKEGTTSICDDKLTALGV